MNSLKTLCAIMCIAAVGCHKPLEPTVAPEPDPPAVTYDSYSALKVGNYWVYQLHNTDMSTNVSLASNSYDSCYIAGDTVINGYTYFKYCSQDPDHPGPVNVDLIRDSLHYIVGVHGDIRFSSEDFTTIFRQTTYGPNLSTPDTFTVKEKMTDENTVITVPAGTFTASSYSYIYSYPPGSSKSDLYKRAWYAKNIGKVKYTLIFDYNNTNIHIERWLVRYHVQ